MRAFYPALSNRYPCARFVLLVLGLSLAVLVQASDRSPQFPKGKGDQCVAETDFMRRNHMDLILHQRDETVIQGIRDEPFSLAECVDCHVQKDARGEHIRVDAEGQFCASCHTYVAAKIDCFGCHAAVPDVAVLIDGDDTRAGNSNWMPNPLLLAAVPNNSHHKQRVSASQTKAPELSFEVEATHELTAETKPDAKPDLKFLGNPFRINELALP